jgi:2-hydroxy-6-oxonona-2,4-dienedioate hydrolase
MKDQPGGLHSRFKVEKRWVVVGAVAAVAIAIIAFTAMTYSLELRSHEERLVGRSQTLQTRFGNLEYAVSGSGPSLLMIHGTGGGFDQGLTFTEPLAKRGFQVISPSRFGYLGSDFPQNASSENQADAFAELLNAMNIDQVTVAGGSAGALSAVQFAMRYPERTSALILIVPAANVRGRDPVEMSPLQRYLVRRLTTSDFLFWLALKLGRDQMIGTLLATDPRLVQQAAPEERLRVERILEEILPVSLRWRGMLKDAELAGNPAHLDFSKITVPTLVISAEDDRFGTAETARDIANAIPEAKLVIFRDGGHIWVGHDRELWEQVRAFHTANAKR